MPELYNYQKQAIAQLLAGKHFIIAGTGMGKSAVAMCWAEQKCKETGKHKVLVVTTASKCKVKNQGGDDDFSADAKVFCSPSFYKSLSSSLSLISWHKLKAWVDANWKSLEAWVIVFDEVAKAGAGVSSGMGRAFLKITKMNPDWAGFTATPGDTWLKYYAYFTACNLVRNKTSFMSEYANVQTYKGYPEIVGWRNEDKLHRMWGAISYAPDASKALQELPKSTKRVFSFSLPKTYATVLKTRMRAGSDGGNMDDFLETSGALISELRRICFTKDKQEWVKDFVEGLDTGAIMFYNFVATGDKLEEIVSKALPKGARVWRIDGKHHEIPTAETAGPRDIILCQWQSGSESLNLQFYWHLVMVELPYSYSTLTQGMGRIQRIGQTHPTFFYTLLCEKGIEQDVREILKTKHDFSLKNWCINNNIDIKEDK